MTEKDKGANGNSMSKESPQRERVGLFVHGGNLSRGIDALGIRTSCADLDFEKFLEWVRSREGDIGFAKYYFNSEIVVDTKETVAFLKKLRKLGMGTKRIEGEPAVWTRMAADMYATINRYDTAVLVSNKDSFVFAIRHLLSAEKRVTLVSPWPDVPEGLRRSGAQIVLLNDVLPDMTMRRIPIPQRIEVSSPVTVFQGGIEPQPAV